MKKSELKTGERNESYERGGLEWHNQKISEMAKLIPELWFSKRIYISMRDYFEEKGISQNEGG